MQLSLLNRAEISDRIHLAETVVIDRIEVVVLFRCPRCTTPHETAQLAEDCCENASGDPLLIHEVDLYQCPNCNKLHDEKQEAIDCCTTDVKTGPNCPACGIEYTTHRDAADCCLWKDLDTLTRWAIADAVEAGSEWGLELKIHDATGGATA